MTCKLTETILSNRIPWGAQDPKLDSKCEVGPWFSSTAVRRFSSSTLVCSWQLRWALRRLMWVGPDIFYQWCMTYDDRNCIVPYVFICPKQALNLHMMFEFFLSALPAAEVVFITKISGSAVASHCRWSLGVHSWCCSGSRWCQPRSGWYYSLFIHQILALRAHQE